MNFNGNVVTLVHFHVMRQLCASGGKSQKSQDDFYDVHDCR